MKILVTGNMGYVGSTVVRHFRSRFPDAAIHGYDNAYFAHCLTGVHQLPERFLDRQNFGDVRDIDVASLRGYNVVVHLAAVSNDPMGNRFARVTTAINQDASLSLAHAAHEAGVRSFVFASSCSVYGVATGAPRNERDPLNPVTAYAASKIGTERGLSEIDGEMVITCLRFATACGMSDRLRLDLVLNDFVACALSQRKITVLSDGTPWRPLIDTADMARAIEWAALRPAAVGGRFLTINTGANDRNYQVRDLAHAVAAAVPGTTVSINTSAPVDSRSYQVDFSRYAALAPKHQPCVTLNESIQQLVDGMVNMGFADPDFRKSSLVRLQVLEGLIAKGQLSEDLIWQRGKS